jgi:hypothetical protein
MLAKTSDKLKAKKWLIPSYKHVTAILRLTIHVFQFTFHLHRLDRLLSRVQDRRQRLCYVFSQVFPGSIRARQVVNCGHVDYHKRVNCLKMNT